MVIDSPAVRLFRAVVAGPVGSVHAGLNTPRARACLNTTTAMTTVTPA